MCGRATECARTGAEGRRVMATGTSEGGETRREKRRRRAMPTFMVHIVVAVLEGVSGDVLARQLAIKVNHVSTSEDGLRPSPP